MPCDYKKYPKNWASEIRPRILARAENKCERCKIPNHELILRGHYSGRDVWQDMDGYIYCASTSKQIGGDYLGEVDPMNRNNFVKIVLIIAHLDHDTDNNVDSNLQALCQRCHLRNDARLHGENSRLTREAKKGLQRLF